MFVIFVFSLRFTCFICFVMCCVYAFGGWWGGGVDPRWQWEHGNLHPNKPNIQRMITNILPSLKFNDQAPPVDDKSEIKNIEGSREDMYPKVYARFMYMISIRDIKAGEELAANYNLNSKYEV